MAKKADLLEKAAELSLEVSEKNTIAEIETAIKSVENTGSQDEKSDTTEANEAKDYAKAGKRSAKAAKEAEEKAQKEARKQAGDTSSQNGDEGEESKKKGPKPVTRPRIERRGKKYQEAAKKRDKNKLYKLEEAVQLAAETSTTKFDASLEFHVKLGVDPRQADQNVRATVSLPHGTGKNIRVAVFAPESEHASAKKAGADIVKDEDFLKQLDKEELNFDVLIATPQYMPKLGKYARLLGPRGLMPNPKAGTVATDVAKSVSEAKTGKVEYRVDKQSNVHLAVGKVSFGKDKLVDNANTFLKSLVAQKPTTMKGVYIHSITVTSTMGPGVKVEYTEK